MQNELYMPIQTIFGVLVGRDAISLNNTHWDGANLTLRISMNGRLGSNPKNEFCDCILSFTEVVAFTVTEFDTWHHQIDIVEDADIYEVNSGSDSSSFDEVLNSMWIKRWTNAASQHYHHYCLGTYDNVFNIICQEFVLEKIVDLNH